jgi:hypothetical protein
MGNLLRKATGTIALRERPELAKDDKKIERAKEDERVDSTQGCRNVQVQPVCEMAEIESKVERDKAEAERINAIFKGATIHQVWESPDIICSNLIEAKNNEHFYMTRKTKDNDVKTNNNNIKVNDSNLKTNTNQKPTPTANNNSMFGIVIKPVKTIFNLKQVRANKEKSLLVSL